MSDFGAPPVIPADLQQYNSYVTDPQYARMFSIIWPSVLAFFALLSLPRLVRSCARAAKMGKGYVWRAVSARVVGVREEWDVEEDEDLRYEREEEVGGRGRQSALRKAEN
ncbi:hypothetical protein D9619_009487 [Psilocybe cf. subviscida]|uniref:Uncharacterized protein n=1 Tax=Psilocybe cf. subviscida TaxID=2480587 RepID=A0A8H5BWB1_9AGAR|nr:hypothetical protein D9619_009487 [Psilocybe cf. subviscida]